MGGESRSFLWRNWRSVGGCARQWAAQALGLAIVSSLLPSAAMAQTTLTWGAGGAGGSGTWNTAISNWWNGTSNTTWSNGNAVFAGTAGTVALGTNGIAPVDVQFNTAGYTLAFDSRQLGISSLGGSALSSTTFIGSSTATSSTNNVIFNHGANDFTFAGTIANNGLGGLTGLSLNSTGRFTLGPGTNYTATGTLVMTTSGPLRLATSSGLPANFEHAAASTSTVELAAGNLSREFVGSFTGTNQFRTRGGGVGFAAISADRTVTMSNVNDVVWGTGGNLVASALTLATADSTGKLTFTHQNAGTGKGLRLANTAGTTTRTITTGNGTADIDAEITMPLMDGATTGHVGALTKQGLGVLKLSAANTYTGATSVSQGVLLIDGTTVATSAVSVASGAAIGGNGTINGNLTLSSGARFAFVTGSTLNVGGSFSLDSLFGVDDLVSPSGSAVDWANIAQGTYTLMNTSFTFNDTNISNFGTAYAETGLAGGSKSAYFQQGSSSLELVVVPEPATMALAAVGVATLAWVYRRRKAVCLAA